MVLCLFGPVALIVLSQVCDVVRCQSPVVYYKLIHDSRELDIVVARAVLAEGDAMERPDIVALHKLPLFDQYGKVKD